MPDPQQSLDPNEQEKIDSICAEFQESWPDVAIEDELKQASDRSRAELLWSLIVLEFELSARGGTAIEPDVYRSRFPNDKTIVNEAIDAARERGWIPQLDNHGIADTVDLPADGETGIDPTIPHQGPSAASPTATRRGQFAQYELLDEIARGGMGVVYKARQAKANRIVALKMILSGRLAGEAEIKRFYTEAEAAAALDHPSIVPIFDVGQQDGQHFFSMAFVEGQSLAERIREEPLPPREAAEIVKTIAGAVHYAHQRGIIHRDLKPANVLLDLQGNPRVTDFGLAKQVDSGQDLTATGQVMGTPNYMPPEQALGRISQLGPAADVYSLGAILYAVLTGRPPFQAASMVETLKQVVEKEPVEPRALNPEVDKDLETICLKCLQKNADSRYATAQELVDELERYLTGQPIVARPVSRMERLRKWTVRNPTVATLSSLAAAAMLSLIVGGAIYQSKLTHALQETRESETAKTNILYESLVSQAQFLTQTRPVGYGERVWGTLDQARLLDSPLVDHDALRRLAVSALGHGSFADPVPLSGLDSRLTKAEVSPDCEHAFLGFSNGEVAVYELNGCSLVDRFLLLDDVVTGIRFVDPETCLVTGPCCFEVHRMHKVDGRWEPESQVQTMRQSDITDLRPSPDGRFLIGWTPDSLSRQSMAAMHSINSWTETAEMWFEGAEKHSTFFCLRPLGGKTDMAFVLPLTATPGFAMNSRYFVACYSSAYGNEDLIRVYDLISREIAFEFKPPGEVRAVAIDDDSNYLAFAGGGGAYVYDVPNRKLLDTVSDNDCRLRQLISESSTVIFREGLTQIVYSIKRGKRLSETSFTESRRGGNQWFSRNGDYRFDVDQQKQGVGIVKSMPSECAIWNVGHPSLHDVEFCPDSQTLILAPGTNHAEFWNVTTQKRIGTFKGGRATMHPSGKLIVEENGQEVCIRTWPDLKRITGLQEPVYTNRIRFSRDGRFFVCYGLVQGRFSVFRIDMGQADDFSDCSLVEVLDDPEGIRAADWSRSSNHLAWVVVPGEQIRVRDFDDPSNHTVDLGENIEASFCNLVYTDPASVNVISNGHIQRWNPLTQTLLKESASPHLNPACKSPDGRYIVYRQKILDAQTLDELAELPTFSGDPLGVDWSPDGRRIAFCYSGGDVAVWELEAVRNRLETLELAWERPEYGESSPIGFVDQRSHPGEDNHVDFQLPMISRAQRDSRFKFLQIQTERDSNWDQRREELFGLLSSDLGSNIDRFGGEFVALCQALQQDTPADRAHEAEMVKFADELDDLWFNEKTGANSFEKSIQSVLDKFQIEPNPTIASRVAHAILLFHYANWLSKNGPPEAATTGYGELATHIDALVRDVPDISERAGHKWFWILRNTAQSLYSSGEHGRAIELIQESIDYQQQHPFNKEQARFARMNYKNLIAWLAAEGREAEIRKVRQRMTEDFAHYGAVESWKLRRSMLDLYTSFDASVLSELLWLAQATPPDLPRDEFQGFITDCDRFTSEHQSTLQPDDYRQLMQTAVQRVGEFQNTNVGTEILSIFVHWRLGVRLAREGKKLEADQIQDEAVGRVRAVVQRGALEMNQFGTRWFWILQNYANCKYTNGKHEQAIEILQEAIEYLTVNYFDTDSQHLPVAYDRLASWLEIANRKDEAQVAREAAQRIRDQ